jgi:DNA-binding response OmpR family regulator
LRIVADARRMAVAGQEITLRAKEFDLLLRLASAPGVVVRRETLMADVWGAQWFGSTKTLDVHVAALRRKLADGGGTAAANLSRWASGAAGAVRRRAIRR